MTSRTLMLRTAAIAALASAFSIACIAQAQLTRADAEKDPILKAMLQEMDRSKTELQLPGFQKPFYIQYRIEDIDAFETRGVFGAPQGSAHSHARIARVTVLVGDYKTDSSSQRGDGALQLAGLSEDPIALRTALWQATDQAYKNALDAYAQKQAELKQVQTPPQADDFSQEKPTVSLAQPLQLKVDEAAWNDRVARDSGIYRSDNALTASRPDVQYSYANFRGSVTTTWLVSSEGTIVRKSASNYLESVAVGTQAADGMRLDRSYVSTGVNLADLDSSETFHKHVASLVASLTALRNAPLVEEEYHGPLLLSADSSADVLSSLLAHSVTATRPRLGTEARTNGPFASSFHARVLPDFMSVVDDPNLTAWNGRPLAGAYAIDDEGIPAQAVQLVTSGKLENYLIGRQPVRDFPHSNGHARAGLTGPARPSIGVLKITAENGVSNDELNKKLLDMARDRGVKNAYFAETMGPGMTPRLLYRVDLDGSRHLVRGARLDDLDQRALRSGVEAAGKDLWVANYPGEVPTTVLAPALLLSDGTVKRANEKNEKLPFYPPPD